MITLIKIDKLSYNKSMIKSAKRKIIRLFSFIKVYRVESIVFLKIVLTFALIATVYFVKPFNNDAYENNFLYPENDEISLRSAFLTWDARFYMSIANEGYDEGMSSAFYPLYPFSIALLKPFLGSVLAGFVLSNIFFVIGSVCFYKLVSNLVSDRIAFSSLVILLLFPTSFFMSLIYTESLCFMLLILFFYFLSDDKLNYAAVCSFLVVLARPTGIFVLIPFTYHLFFSRMRRSNFIYLVFPIVAFLLVQFIIFLYTGDFWAGFKAQRYFCAENTVANIFKPLSWIEKNFISADIVFHHYTQSFLDRVSFLFFSVLLCHIWKNQKREYFLFSLSMGLVTALMGSFMSYMRFLLLVFPIFIELAVLFQKNKYLKFYISIVFVIIQIYLISQYSTNNWAA